MHRNKGKQNSLRNRMKRYYIESVFPSAILILILLISLIGIGKSYDNIVVNITTANKNNLTFKHDVDYALYRTVIGSANNWDTTYDKDIKDPYVTIKNLKDNMLFLRRRTKRKETLKKIDNILKRLKTLKDMTDTIIERSKGKGHYDENMQYLELNVYVMTQLITEQVYEYIYYEAVNMNKMRHQLNLMLIAIVVFGSVSYIIIFMRLFATNKHISQSVLLPLEELCQTTNEIAKGDFSIHPDEKYDYEISMLSISINNMSREISRLLKKTRQEQEQLRLTELQLYQSQINPHFLYNTLDTIIALVESKMPSEAVKLIERLSVFFRTTLSEGRSKISVREEIRHVVSYLEIQAIRYQDIMQYTVDIDSSILDYQIIKLSLQPIVENALYHGIKQKRGKGLINIKGYKEGSSLCFVIEDNGIGMDGAEVKALTDSLNNTDAKKRKGFGLSNVHQRICLNYGKMYGLKIESKKNKGTKIFIHFPICI